MDFTLANITAILLGLVVGRHSKLKIDAASSSLSVLSSTLYFLIQFTDSFTVAINSASIVGILFDR